MIALLLVAAALIAAAGYVAYRVAARPGPALARAVDPDSPPKRCPGCLMCAPPDWL